LQVRCSFLWPRQRPADGGRQAALSRRPGDTIYVPAGIYHSTVNDGREPLRLIAIYNPGGPERDRESLPDFQEVPAGTHARLTRE